MNEALFLSSVQSTIDQVSTTTQIPFSPLPPPPLLFLLWFPCLLLFCYWLVPIYSRCKGCHSHTAAVIGRSWTPLWAEWCIYWTKICLLKCFPQQAKLHLRNWPCSKNKGSCNKMFSVKILCKMRILLFRTSPTSANMLNVLNYLWYKRLNFLVPFTVFFLKFT